MRKLKNIISPVVLILALFTLSACQMQTLFTGTMGKSNFEITFPKSMPAGTVTGGVANGSSSRLLLSNSTFLSVIVRQGGSIVMTQNYQISANALSVKVSLNLQLATDYVIEANAYDTQGGTIICQGIINYNSTKNGAITACTLVPYSMSKWPLLTPDPTYFASSVNSTIKSNKSYTVQVDFKGQYGIVIPTFTGFETHIQDNDGSPVNGISDSKGDIVIYASDLRNPSLPPYITYYNISGKDTSITGTIFFPNPIDIVYNGTSQADIAYASALKTLLESRLFKTTTVSGKPTLWNVSLVDQATIPSTYSSTFTLSKGLVLLTNGSSLTSSAKQNQIRNLLNAGRGFIAMGNSVNAIDIINANYSTWFGTASPAGSIGYANSTGSTGNSLLVFTHSTWNSPLSSSATPAVASPMQWCATSGTFIEVSNPRASNPSGGYLIARDGNNPTYFPVVSQDRFMQFGISTLPDTTVGQVFLTNCLSFMAGY